MKPQIASPNSARMMTKLAAVALLLGLCVPADAAVIALYDAEGGPDGDFNTTAFDSKDLAASTDATRLSQGGGITGGGAGVIIGSAAANAAFGPIFQPSDSQEPGFNLAHANQGSQAAAAGAGDFISFQILSNGNSVAYDSVSFFMDKAGGGQGQIDVAYTIDGGSEVFVEQNIVPPNNNAPVAFKAIDFVDFTTALDVTWTFYLYAAGTNNAGIRFDDITLNGVVAGGSGGDIPAPAALPAGLALIGALAARRRR